MRRMHRGNANTRAEPLDDPSGFGPVRADAAVSRHAAQSRRADLARLPRAVYRLRVLGMALGGLCIAAVLHENGASWPAWLALAFTGLAWPQLALFLAMRSGKPYRTEVRNLLFDSVLAGMWVPLMQFNLLPSVLLITLTTVDKISTGIPRLWLWSLPGMVLAGLATAALTGLRFQPETSLAVMVACLPMLLIHTIAVSLSGSRLIRRVRRQNRQLDALSRIDGLTGLHGRRHWQEQAEETLRQVRVQGTPATLLMIDIDRFKSINDQYGHAAGDEMLRAVADVIRDSLRDTDPSGRYGGDEFAVVMRDAGMAEALATAERIRRGVERLHPDPAAERTVTVSIGLAEADGRHAALREWIEAADGALYRAKSAGRNRVFVQEAAPG